MKKKLKLLLIAILLLLNYNHTEAGVTIPTYIAEKYKTYLEAWLSGHPTYRIAVETDCISCAKSIKHLRIQNYGDWKALPNYQPYYTVGDFNSDSVDDFAIAVIDEHKANKKFLILVFNGPFKASSLTEPAFVSEPLDLSNSGMFYDGPRPKPWRLLVGPFESEGRLLIPQGKTYKWDAP